MFNRRMFSLVSFMVMAVLAFGSSFAVAADSGVQIQLSVKIPENQAFVFESIMNMTMDLGGFELGYPMVQTTEERQVFRLEYGETQADGTTPFTMRTLEISVNGVDISELLGDEAASAYFLEGTGLVNSDGSLEELYFSQDGLSLDDLGMDITQLMQNVFVPFPDYPLAIGDSWEVAHDFPYELAGFNVVEFVADARYTLIDFDTVADTATFESSLQGYSKIEIEMSSDDDPSLPEGMIMTIVMTVDMEAEGISVIELSTGHAIFFKMTVDQLSEVQLVLPGFPVPIETITMPATIDVEMRLVE